MNVEALARVTSPVTTCRNWALNFNALVLGVAAATDPYQSTDLFAKCSTMITVWKQAPNATLMEGGGGGPVASPPAAPPPIAATPIPTLANVTVNTTISSRDSLSGFTSLGALCQIPPLAACASPVQYAAEFRISGEHWTVLLQNATAVQEIKAAVASDLSSQLGHKTHVQSLRLGSLIVNATVETALPNINTMLPLMIANSSWIRRIKTTYETAGGTDQLQLTRVIGADGSVFPPPTNAPTLSNGTLVTAEPPVAAEDEDTFLGLSMFWIIFLITALVLGCVISIIISICCCCCGSSKKPSEEEKKKKYNAYGRSSSGRGYPARDMHIEDY